MELLVDSDKSFKYFSATKYRAELYCLVDTGLNIVTLSKFLKIKYIKPIVKLVNVSYNLITS